VTAPYYTGDTVPLKFTITDSDGNVNPSAAKILILKPDNTMTAETDATRDGNAVSYNVPANVTEAEGMYRAYFICTLSYGERTHMIEFTINRNPEKFPR